MIIFSCFSFPNNFFLLYIFLADFRRVFSSVQTLFFNVFSIVYFCYLFFLSLDMCFLHFIFLLHICRVFSSVQTSFFNLVFCDISVSSFFSRWTCLFFTLFCCCIFGGFFRPYRHHFLNLFLVDILLDFL